MDNAEIILILLTIILMAMVIGMAGIVYFLGRLHRILNQVPENVPGALREPVPAAKPLEAVGKPAVPAETEDYKNARSLQEYLSAIGEKYRLTSLTLATTDGLIIGSTKTDAQEEAATYSYLYAQGNLPEGGGVELIGIDHHGETVVGIARPSEHLSTELMSALEQDTRDALRQWV
jgi:hypothetical protein